jgi:hypothetical protein
MSESAERKRKAAEADLYVDLTKDESEESEERIILASNVRDGKLEYLYAEPIMSPRFDLLAWIMLSNVCFTIQCQVGGYARLRVFLGACRRSGS